MQSKGRLGLGQLGNMGTPCTVEQRERGEGGRVPGSRGRNRKLKQCKTALVCSQPAPGAAKACSVCCNADTYTEAYWSLYTARVRLNMEKRVVRANNQTLA